MKSLKKDDAEVVSASVLARRLGITQTSVSRMAGDGILVKAARGQYRAWESVRNYLNHMRAASTGKTSPASIARAKLLDIQAKRAQFQYEAEMNEWIRIDSIGPVVIERFSLVRNACLAASARIGARLPHLSRQDLVEIDDVLHEALHEMRKVGIKPTGDGGADLIEP